MSGMLDPTKIQQQINAAATCAAVDEIVTFVQDMVSEIVGKLNAQKNKLTTLISSSVPATFIANMVTHLTDTITEITQTITELTDLLTNLTTWAGLRKALLGC